MQCTERYLPLCSIPARMSRDGYAGPNAHIYIPFCGFVFFNGATFTFPGSTIPQDNKRYVGGVTMPDNFTKGDAGVCGI